MPLPLCQSLGVSSHAVKSGCGWQTKLTHQVSPCSVMKFAFRKKHVVFKTLGNTQMCLSNMIFLRFCLNSIAPLFFQQANNVWQIFFFFSWIPRQYSKMNGWALKLEFSKVGGWERQCLLNNWQPECRLRQLAKTVCGYLWSSNWTSYRVRARARRWRGCNLRGSSFISMSPS